MLPLLVILLLSKPGSGKAETRINVPTSPGSR